MESLYSISELAKYFNISNQTLHFYDKIGLLKPTYVNPQTGYRYYNQEQFNKMFTIIELKNIGFSLDEIAEIQKNRDLSSMESLIMRNHDILTRKIEELEEIKNRTEYYLDVIEASKHPRKASDIRLEHMPSRKMFYVRVDFSINELSKYVEITYKSYVKASGLSGGLLKKTPMGKMVFTMDESSLRNKKFKYYSGIGLTVPDDTEHRSVIELKESLYAIAKHIGSYDSLPQTYRKLISYIEENGYEISGMAAEVSLVSIVQTDRSEEFVTEIQIPVRKKEGIE